MSLADGHNNSDSMAATYTDDTAARTNTIIIGGRCLWLVNNGVTKFVPENRMVIVVNTVAIQQGLETFDVYILYAWLYELLIFIYYTVENIIMTNTYNDSPSNNYETNSIILSTCTKFLCYRRYR